MTFFGLLYLYLQKRIVEELELVFADDWYRPCTVDDASQLKYLECCIKESSRLYPSAPLVGRSIALSPLK